MKKFIVLTFSLIMAITGLGCAALSYYITPAPKDEKAVKYVVDAGIAEAEDYAGYANLVKALQLQKDVDVAYEVIMFNLQQTIDSEELRHTILKKSTNANAKIGLDREAALFSEKGLLSFGLSLIGVSGFTGVLGLMRKRPGDWSKDEVDSAITEATGTTLAELEAKNKHLTQVVKGISEFMKQYKGNEDVILALKAACDKAQDTDTQIAVAGVKKES